jgi:3-carboxy-cis,cis-muconate cycloisomerase
MRPSSSPSDALFAALTARGPVAEQVDGRAWLRAMLDVEAALARATAAAGLIPDSAARTLAQACADEAAYDLTELGHEAGLGGNPVIPLVRAIERRAGADGAHVHHGATSQDVLDTALVLVARRALAALLDDLHATVAVAARLAAEHRDTVVAGRTLLQHAAPTTFGLKAAGWGAGLHGAADRAAAIRLPVQLGGAAGTLSAYSGRGREVVRLLAAELQLEVPTLPWHALRLPIADLAGGLGTTAGIVGKVALDVILLAQTEVGEVMEGGHGRGGSSAMPHKRNPVAAIQARAAARRAPGLVATLFACMDHEHERAAGAWHAEWLPLVDLLSSTGTAVAWLRESLESLVVDPLRMRRNLDAVGADLVAEPLAEELRPALGRERAHELLAAATARARAERRSLGDVLLDDEEVARVLPRDRLDVLLATGHRTGEAGELVDAALAALTSPGGIG